ncbi:TetR family transcriptional regulator C-terminal domain-containing protein [Rhodovibrionaceae bacterium A322]
MTREFRQQQIISATIESINKAGFSGTTLATVAKEAGISQASLIFHFKTKEALLTAVLTHLTNLYQETWKSALMAAPLDPISRICVMVNADFKPIICNRKTLAVWHAFWGESKARPTYMKLCGGQDEERYDQMVKEVIRLSENEGADAEDARAIADSIDGLSDGLWTRLLLRHSTFKRKDALRIMYRTLLTQFPDHREVIEAYKAKELGTTAKEGTLKNSA